MTATRLIADLARLGIRLEAHGDRLRYSPRSAVTPDLADRMKAHKAELLAILRRDPDDPAIDRTNATAVWQAALAQLNGDLLFSPDLMEALRSANVQWADEAERTETDKTDYWWGQLSPEQQAELMPRPIKRPCPWCKRTEHTDICNELRWRSVMPFGKYKGRSIDELPEDYVHWLAKKKVRLPEDLRNEIYDTFGIVIHPVDETMLPMLNAVAAPQMGPNIYDELPKPKY